MHGLLLIGFHQLLRVQWGYLNTHYTVFGDLEKIKIKYMHWVWYFKRIVHFISILMFEL